MSGPVRLLIPILPPGKDVFFKGYVVGPDQSGVAVFIIKYFTNNDKLVDLSSNFKDIIYGYCGEKAPKAKFSHLYNYLIMKQNNAPHFSKLVIHGKEVDVNNNCIIMLYDLETVMESQTISDSDDYFTKLQSFIQEDTGLQRQSTMKPTPSPSWVLSSMFLQYIFNYFNLFSWLFNTIGKERKISIKQGNLIISILVDLFLGYVVLQLLSQDKKEISSFLLGILETLINSLYSLLKWLMGAPVGLKLNTAFNKMLGQYFSYHVQLWWLFLNVSGEKLDIILYIYSYLGYLGLTFQTAVISDMICIATFHSYCIYVYAARLFNMQISGLIALLRLFVGRKYNPLRGGIDSCEYTNQELFVGTVAFTILLLLLPTTTMYYIVFTLFRVLSLAVQYILAKLIYFVQTLPLYVVTLWLTHSPKVSGNILMEVASDSDDSPLVLRMKSFSKSLKELVDNFKPPVEMPNTVEWTNLISNVLRGKQIDLTAI